MGIKLNGIVMLLVFASSRTSCKSLPGGDHVQASIAEDEAVKSRNQRQSFDNLIPTGLIPTGLIPTGLIPTGNPSDIINGLVSDGTHLVSDGVQSATNLLMPKSVIQMIWEFILNFLHPLWEFFLSLFGRQSAGPIGDGAKLLANTINDTIGSIGKGVKNAVAKVQDTVGNVLSNPLNASNHLPLVAAGQDVVDGINKGVGDVGKAVDGFLSTAKNQTKPPLPAVKDIQNSIQKGIEGIEHGVGNILGVTASTNIPITGETRKPPVIVQAVANVDNTIHNGIENIEKGVGDFFHLALPTPPRLFGG